MHPKGFRGTAGKGVERVHTYAHGLGESGEYMQIWKGHVLYDSTV